MKISDFTFDLPQELIAQTPAQRRGDDRLLVIDRKTGEYQDMQMSDFPSLIEPGSVIVVNDTKVRKARVFGISETGGKVEFLFTGALGPDRWQAMVSKSKKQRPGKGYDFLDKDGNTVKIVRNIKPWRPFIWGGWRARKVLETRATATPS